MNSSNSFLVETFQLMDDIRYNSGLWISPNPTSVGF
jgi:hypothetical protein